MPSQIGGKGPGVITAPRLTDSEKKTQASLATAATQFNQAKERKASREAATAEQSVEEAPQSTGVISVRSELPDPAEVEVATRSVLDAAAAVTNQGEKAEDGERLTKEVLASLRAPLFDSKE